MCTNVSVSVVVVWMRVCVCVSGLYVCAHEVVCE